jgi:hypothetical protein
MHASEWFDSVVKQTQDEKWHLGPVFSRHLIAIKKLT